MKTTYTYDHYFKYDEIKTILESFADKFPDLIDLQVNCVTLEGRNQYVATLTNKKTGNALDKPGWYLDGNIHAGEVTASMCAMHTIDYLLTNYGTDKDCTKILDEMCIYVIPRVTPDGAEMYLSSPYSLRSVDRVHNDKEGGIKEEDIDNDGVIRMMAIKTSYGAWKKSKEDASLMELRDPSDDEGIFYDIYPEGLLEEYDGDENLKVRKKAWGLDFNRNFPYGWYPEPRQSGAGDYPLSNPETKAIADFVLAHPNIGGAAIGHTSGGLILYPPGTKASYKAPQSDIEILKAIARMGEEELSYQPMNIFDSFLSSQEFYDSGALDDWMYETQGIPAYTMEFWDVNAKAGVKYNWGEKKDSIYDDLKRFTAIMKWVKENAPEYFVDWKKFDHPKFGEVELGGFNFKFTQQNPPEKFLLEELEHDTKFNLRFIKAMPKLCIDSISAEKIEEGIYKIEAVVANKGYLSTSLTQNALDNDYAKPVIVDIEGGEILSGKESTEIKELQGYSQTQTGVYYYGNITTFASAKAKKKLSWIVKADEGTQISIKASQIKAGKATKQITL
ncbi:MAG: zinc carboxypeptidase [Erysipelotrichaceae bacterium]|nr:zinc carboxypeptidase [Erysipelotrichaceae bacterium]